MGKLARTFHLMAESWRLLRRDPRLLVFPAISFAATAVIFVLFAFPVYVSYHGRPEKLDGSTFDPQLWFGFFLFYLVCYFITIFFNSALIACVLRRFDGERPTLGYGLRAAVDRLPGILGWAFLASTVGMLLRCLQERAGLLGRFAIGLLGMAWTLTAYLVVPVLVAEGVGPIAGYRRSVALLKQTWGEQIAGNVSFGLIFALFGILPAWALVMALSAAHAGAVPILLLIAAAAVWLVVLALVQSTLQSIYQAAVYAYAASGEAPSGFDGSLLAGAYRPK